MKIFALKYVETSSRSVSFSHFINSHTVCQYFFWSKMSTPHVHHKTQGSVPGQSMANRGHGSVGAWKPQKLHYATGREWVCTNGNENGNAQITVSFLSIVGEWYFQFICIPGPITWSLFGQLLVTVSKSHLVTIPEMHFNIITSRGINSYMGMTQPFILQSGSF